MTAYFECVSEIISVWMYMSVCWVLLGVWGWVCLGVTLTSVVITSVCISSTYLICPLCMLPVVSCLFVQDVFSSCRWFLFIPCGRLSWLPVSFLLHGKYTLSYHNGVGSVVSLDLALVLNDHVLISEHSCCLGWPAWRTVSSNSVTRIAYCKFNEAKQPEM